jgi:hypothetical protein
MPDPVLGRRFPDWRRCVMRNSRHSVSLGTFGLAFAVVLSPSLLQTSELICSNTGDTTLSLLEFEVSGEDQIASSSSQRDYDVSLPVDAGTATVRAQPTAAD